VEDDRELLAATQSGPRVVLANKADLSAAWPIEAAGVDLLAVSAKSGCGIDELRRAIITALSSRDRLRDTPAVTNARHADLLSRAADALRRAAHAAEERTAEEFVAADLTDARALLEEVTGARTPDDVLHAIFSRFCIGK
jgi:tRNA modification GTPase